MTASTIRLARGLAMPLDAVTEKFAIIGNSGMGKSTAATTFVEQFYAAGLPSVVLDVKGDWWGLRSSRDGKGPGLPFVIFGGEHADVPLEPTAGTLVADTIVDYQMSAIIDMSLMSKRKARTFTTAFAEQLYYRNRDPLMVVVDEADVLIPQRPDAETWRLIGAMEDIAKRGRGHGLGLTIASQRGQEVNQSVLDIIGNVILLGMTGRLTIKAIRDWISVNADQDETSAREVIGSLPSLEVGEAWVWSPAFMRTVKRVKINMFSTFDSHTTPRAGQKRVVPVKRAEINLAKLGEEISATVERAKAADPKALRVRVTQLERELAKAEQMVAERDQMIESQTAMLDDARAREPEVVEVPARVPPNIAGAINQSIREMEGALTDAREALKLIDALPVEDAPKPVAHRNAAALRPAPTRLPAASKPRPVPRTVTAVGPGDSKLSKMERAVLSALAPYAPNPRSAKQVALIAQYSSKGGGFRNTLGALRTSGYIQGQNASMTITEAGLAALGEYEPLPSGAALVEHWCASPVLGKPHAAALRAIVDAYPNAISAAEVAEQTGYEAGGGGFRNALGKLRSLELIVGTNAAMRASDELID